MKIKNVIIIATLCTGLAVFTSCEKDNESGDSNMSQTGDTKSHNAGQNCMNCHKAGGNGDGQFNVAGTVYNAQLASTFPNAVIKLYSQANGSGTLRATINGDANGNFFTTEAVDFTGGLYPAILGSGTNIKYMSGPITSGACSSCHGGSTSKLWVN